jgi:hypothetical protein
MLLWLCRGSLLLNAVTGLAALYRLVSVTSTIYITAPLPYFLFEVQL